MCRASNTAMYAFSPLQASWSVLPDMNPVP
jgi:hypothetical protein